MPTHFMSYWRPGTADRELEHGGLVNHSGSNQYGRVSPGDTVWIVTVRRGALFLLGRIDASAVVNQSEAARRLGLAPAELWDASDHIIADDRTVAPLREIAAADIAGFLRFQSKRDRLEIVEGRVSPSQLQSMRALTPEAADLLEARWVEDGSILAQAGSPSPGVGAGFGTAAENRQVERAAIDAAKNLLQRDGWKVTSVEAQRIGYDLFCTRGDEVRRAEVKGIRGTGLDFIITAAEHARAMEDSDFEVIVVSSALSNPRPRRFSAAELASQYDFAAIAYRASFLGVGNDDDAP